MGSRSQSAVSPNGGAVVIVSASPSVRRLFVTPGDRVDKLTARISAATDQKLFLHELEETAKACRDSQLRAESTVLEKWEAKLRPGAGARTEDFPEGSPMRHQMQPPGSEKPKPSITTEAT